MILQFDNAQEYKDADNVTSAGMEENYVSDMEDSTRYYLTTIGQVPVCGPEEEIECTIRALRGDQQAKNRLVECNLRMVVSAAKKYMGCGLPLIDLIQEGTIGLIKATNKFDYRLGNKFSTYATYWIKQGISRAVANYAKLIRVPVHMVETVNKVRKAKNKLYFKFWREPTIEEIAEYLELPVRTIQNVFKTYKEIIPLEQPINDEDDGATIQDFIHDDSVNPIDTAVNSVLHDDLMKILKETLNERELNVIMMRFGLDNEDRVPKTLDEVGAEYDVTKERIRQIEYSAFQKLSESDACNALRNYIQEEK